MRLWRYLAPFICLVFLLTASSCGKKAPPFLSEKQFTPKVVNLNYEWLDGDLHLMGDIVGQEDGKSPYNTIHGCRIYYSRYSPDSPPCAGCPMEYQGYHDLGSGVVTTKGFSANVGGSIRGSIWIFKVHFVGPGGVLGPESNKIQVDAK